MNALSSPRSHRAMWKTRLVSGGGVWCIYSYLDKFEIRQNPRSLRSSPLLCALCMTYDDGGLVGGADEGGSTTATPLTSSCAGGTTLEPLTRRSKRQFHCVRKVWFKNPPCSAQVRLRDTSSSSRSGRPTDPPSEGPSSDSPPALPAADSMSTTSTLARTVSWSKGAALDDDDVVVVVVVIAETSAAATRLAS